MGNDNSFTIDSYLLDIKDESAREFMRKYLALPNECGAPASVTSWYEWLFGNPETLSPLSKQIRIKFFNSRLSRAEILDEHLKNGDITDVDSFDEIAAVLKRSAIEHGFLQNSAQ